MGYEEIKLNPEWDGKDGEFLVALGHAFENGTVFEKNYTLARSFYTIAANAGYAQGTNNLAWLYQNGLGVEKDVARAVEIYEDAAKDGNSCAMVNLGNIYEKGELTGESDYKQAFHWYEAAAEDGDPKGIFNYANYYHWGWGVRKNYKKAFSLFSVLTEEGHFGAAFYMGLYYQEGYGVKKDYSLARHYYRLGALEDDPCCFNQLGTLYAKGLGVEKDCSAALDYYKKAAEGGDDLGYANVGWLYEAGELGKPDLQEAIRWYQLGADKGEEHCVESLERLGIQAEEQEDTSYREGTLYGLDLIQAYQRAPERFLPMIDPPERHEKNRYGETDIGWNAGLLLDSRPFFAECWAKDGMTMMTFYLSTRGIEDYSGDDVIRLIHESGFFHFKEPGQRGFEALKFNTSKGEEFFSVTIPVGFDDAPALLEGAPILPWSVLTEYKKQFGLEAAPEN